MAMRGAGSVSATLLGAGGVCGGALTIASRQMPLDSLFGDLLESSPVAWYIFIQSLSTEKPKRIR